MTPSEITIAIRNLAAIEREGRLADLQIAFANECRKAGGIPADDWRQRMVETNANTEAVARAAADLFGGSVSKWQQLAQQALARDKFTDIALRLIADFRVQLGPPASDSRLLTDEEKLQYNPVTGGPVNAAWEREQRAAKQEAAKKPRRKW